MLDHGSPHNGDRERPLHRIAIHDNGAGMTADKMKEVLQRIGDSEKIDLALRGEQGIGLLAFALIAMSFISLRHQRMAGRPIAWS